jgi:hypothetical protein
MHQRRKRFAFVVLVVASICVLAFGAAAGGMLGGHARALVLQWRDPQIGQDQLRQLIAGLSAETTQADVRARLSTLDELGVVDRPGWNRIWVYPSLRRGAGWDATVLLTYRPDGRLLLLESYYPTSAEGPLSGIPTERCFVPGKCGPELYMFGRPVRPPDVR